jgi:hypothetical protein
MSLGLTVVRGLADPLAAGSPREPGRQAGVIARFNDHLPGVMYQDRLCLNCLVGTVP